MKIEFSEKEVYLMLEAVGVLDEEAKCKHSDKHYLETITDKLIKALEEFDSM
jgi:hypothetical protein